MTWLDVIGGADRYSVEKADCIELLSSLPPDSIDLLITSPPYEAARSYSIGFNLKGEEWVAWMVEVVKAAAPKVKGLIAINCEGQTKDFRYSATPFLLAADLHRAGFNLRKPVVYARSGMPGSGGPDWLRNDWEPIICINREGKLPFSDNVACGEAPKFEVGGAMSNRHMDGKRENSQHRKFKLREEGKKVGGRRSREPDGTRSYSVYVNPDVSNPGNVIKCKVGGGHMGHPLAHDNEAPFPIDLPLFFIRSFCPPNGIVCDPFVGSGTTIDAAIQTGRRCVSCDIRESQVDLVRKRLRTVTPCVPGMES
jgi:site-specific DNA-methyltransferase (adenine-specific)